MDKNTEEQEIIDKLTNGLQGLDSILQRMIQDMKSRFPEIRFSALCASSVILEFFIYEFPSRHSKKINSATKPKNKNTKKDSIH